jgi:hypothetical protein
MKIIKLPNANAAKLRINNEFKGLYTLIKEAAGDVSFEQFEKLRNQIDGIILWVEGPADIQAIFDGNVGDNNGIDIGPNYTETFTHTNVWNFKFKSTGDDSFMYIQLLIS